MRWRWTKNGFIQALTRFRTDECFMAYIYLHKLFVPEEEKNRVDPDDIRMIKPIETEDGTGSLVTFNNNDSMKYRESPQEIECKEWQMRYLWPNVERITMAILGGIIGGLLTLLFKHGV